MPTKNAIYDKIEAITLGSLSGANNSLSNLSSVAVNLSLLPGTDNTLTLGGPTKTWADLFVGSGGTINFHEGDVTLTHGTNLLTLGGGNLALGTNSLTLTGSLAATGSRVTKGWFTDLEMTNLPSVNGTALTTTIAKLNYLTSIAGISGTATGKVVLDIAPIITDSIRTGNRPYSEVDWNNASGSPTRNDLRDLFVSGLTNHLPVRVYSYSNGMLVKTDIAASSNTMFTLEITGMSYGQLKPVKILLQGYNYNNGNAITVGNAISSDWSTDISVFNYEGVLCFWLIQGSAYQSFGYECRSYNTGAAVNHVASVTDIAKPTTGVTREITITPKQMWNSGNDGAGSFLDADLLDGQEGSYYQPALSGGVAKYLTEWTGTGTIDTAKLYHDGSEFRVNTTTDAGDYPWQVAGSMYLGKSGATTLTAPALRIHNTYNNILQDSLFGGLEFYSSDASGGGTGVSGYLRNIATNAGVSSALVFGVRSTAPTNGMADPELKLTVASLDPFTSNGLALGSTTNMWSDLFLFSGGVINFNAGDVTLTHGTNLLTLGGGNLALGANSLTMTGSLAATASRVTKGWFTDIESTNVPTVGGIAIVQDAITDAVTTRAPSQNAVFDQFALKANWTALTSIHDSLYYLYSIRKPITQRLAVSADDHNLMVADGTDFFWLGDTGWWIFNRLTLDEINTYFDDRVSKGYNVIQAVIPGYSPDNIQPTNQAGAVAWTNNNPTTPNEAYYSFVDQVIELAQSKGLYMALLPAWGNEVNPFTVAFGDTNTATITSTSIANTYGHYLGARYADFPNIVWVMGGDRPPKFVNGDAEIVATSFDNIAIWDALAAALKSENPNTLITYHPWTYGPLRSPTETIRTKTWLDFTGTQSGHKLDWSGAYANIAIDYAHAVVKPVINLEPLYEQLIYAGSDRATDYQIRKSIYRSVFAGSAGITYGNLNVFQFYNPVRYAAYQSANENWITAKDDPGAFQMGYLKRLMESRPYNTRIPESSLLTYGNQSDSAKAMKAFRDPERTCIMLYMPYGDQVTVNTSALSASVTNIFIWWFDPETGIATFMGTQAKGASLVITPPETGAKDWVLIIEGDNLYRQFVSEPVAETVEVVQSTDIFPTGILGTNVGDGSNADFPIWSLSNTYKGIAGLKYTGADDAVNVMNTRLRVISGDPNSGLTNYRRTLELVYSDAQNEYQYPGIVARAYSRDKPPMGLITAFCNQTDNYLSFGFGNAEPVANISSAVSPATWLLFYTSPNIDTDGHLDTIRISVNPTGKVGINTRDQKTRLQVTDDITHNAYGTGAQFSVTERINQPHRVNIGFENIGTPSTEGDGYGFVEALYQSGHYDILKLNPFGGEVSVNDKLGFKGISVNNTFIADNLRWDGTYWRYKSNGYGFLQQFYNGEMYMYTIPIGSAGGIGTYTQRLKVGTTGISVPTGGSYQINGSTIIDNTAYASSWDGVTTISPSKNVVYDKLASIGEVYSTKVSFTAAQLNTAYAIPVTVISGPGTNRIIQVVSMVAQLNYLTSTFNDIDLYLYCAGIVNPVTQYQAYIEGYMMASSSSHQWTVPCYNPTQTEGLASGAQILLKPASDLTTGGGSLTLHIMYRIIDMN